MYAKNRLVVFAAMTASAVAFCCAGTTAPRGWLPSSAEIQSRSTGAWASVKTISGGSSQLIEGELIAVHSDSLFVLTVDGLAAVGRNRISRARLTSYLQESQNVGVWTAAGALSTISHGVILVISAPVWIIGGASMAAAASREPILTFETHTPGDTTWPSSESSSLLDQQDIWNKMRPWSRFPQGLSPNIDRALLGQLTLGWRNKSK
jgi:hypothetical protein